MKPRLATIAQLRARKQRYKLRMFERLYYILLGTVVIIAIFFVVSSLSFSGRLAEDYAAKSWRVRWWLLDGWLALLYLAAFASIYEIAQDEEDAEDYDLEALSSRTRARDDDDNATLVADRENGRPANPREVVFEIGDEEPGSDGEEDTHAKKRRNSSDNHGTDHERQGLIGERSRSD
ncbi:hypothetical protein H0H93_014212 [Arthromyces matolae]|nr:hypothetical protein H0H93_014212 [Arthromyces matolae]